ncbi:diguanylate cyclase domain-containing protein [Streptomyces atroolivaceus]|uniref:diguanylate cyclase domain-containing protein n=1 Tax=Streptomyces atroolivaceus TaxID=66869 RepID=UPI0036511003
MACRLRLTNVQDSETRALPNHFKPINDTLGHAAGDAVIAATAEQLSAWAGNRAAVGRLGGDEFALTLRLAPERRPARLPQLVHKLAQPVVLEATASSRSPRRTARPPGTRWAPRTSRPCNAPPTPPSTRASTPAARSWPPRPTSPRPPSTDAAPAVPAPVPAPATKRTKIAPRPWSWRGWLLQHSSQRIDTPALRDPLVARTIRGRHLHTGTILGVTRLTACHQDLTGRVLSARAERTRPSTPSSTPSASPLRTRR